MIIALFLNNSRRPQPEKLLTKKGRSDTNILGWSTHTYTLHIYRYRLHIIRAELLYDFQTFEWRYNNSINNFVENSPYVSCSMRSHYFVVSLKSRSFRKKSIFPIRNINLLVTIQKYEILFFLKNKNQFSLLWLQKTIRKLMICNFTLLRVLKVVTATKVIWLSAWLWCIRDGTVFDINHKNNKHVQYPYANVCCNHLNVAAF